MLLLVGWGKVSSIFYPPEDVTMPAAQRASAAVVSFGNGSGFLISSQGHILTNHHIAEGFGGWGVVRRGQASGHPGEPLEVVLIADHPESDLALYRAYAGHPLPYLPLGEAAPPVGTDVFMVSHPNRAAQKVSFGEIVAPTRDVGGVPGIQYDLATSWGSSGAPVLDAEGRVVAVHRAWFENSRAAGVVGIPVDHLRSLRWIPADVLRVDAMIP